MALSFRLVRGDLSKYSASIVVTSANDGLVSPTLNLYWRFTSRKSVDGAIRNVAGPDLVRACLEFEQLSDGQRRNITRWTQTAKRGASAVQRCAPGDTVVTRAYGLDADYIVHAVAPDSEFMYQGHYQGEPGERGEGAIRLESSPPLDLLRSCYDQCWQRTEQLEAPCIALPSLGTGVKAWRPAISCAIAIDSLFSSRSRRPRDVTFVLGDDASAVAWTKMATSLLGTPVFSSISEKLLGLWEFEDISILPPLSISELNELKPKPMAKPGWAGDYWKPTSNGY
mmetsp:Transcript_687/g.910  ORF Transcript_687/g.910 Transcript_687/m.910 type:complete len:283 (-) Transcript_687:61-909(-)